MQSREARFAIKIIIISLAFNSVQIKQQQKKKTQLPAVRLENGWSEQLCKHAKAVKLPKGGLCSCLFRHLSNDTQSPDLTNKQYWHKKKFPVKRCQTNSLEENLEGKKRCICVIKQLFQSSASALSAGAEHNIDAERLVNVQADKPSTHYMQHD